MNTKRACTTLLLGTAFGVLAYQPLAWLIRSWYAPGYESPGALVFALVCGIFLWSATSRLVDGARVNEARAPSWPMALLLSSFVVRLLSQVLVINVLGALMLALDLYALGLLFRLNERVRAANPLWLACLFCFALPLEPLLQRSIGFFLQQMSAQGACGLLQLVHDQAGCEGVRLYIDNVDVLVDLPCSGARLLILVLIGFFTLATLGSFSVSRGACGLVLALGIAWVGNTLRIVLLSWGIRYADLIGVNVMLDPWHSLIGLCITAAALAVMLRWSQAQTSSRPATSVGSPNTPHRPAFLNGSLPLWAAGATLLGALGIVSLTAQPFDVSRELPAIELPITLAGMPRSPMSLSAAEQSYLAAYGGQAARAGYGEHSLLLVRTSSPLRHLHAPDVCFTASGYQVDYLGVDFSGTPSAVYRAQSPDGAVLRVQARFVSSRGTTAHSISEVVWRWFGQPDEVWTMVQTVSPWHHSNDALTANPPPPDQSRASNLFDSAVARALNFSFAG